ncbi:hypothetical protein [Streptomyces sp. NPDC001508]|uniref:hypothetical protein n=1 Tax=Streptomyces sp. NPDC001508 TaxID=3154656 RepID=UPI00332FD42B
MTAQSPHGDIHTGDVSGTFVVGDNNRVTTTTHHPEQPQPQPQSRQENSVEGRAAVFAVEDGTMNVTYNTGAEREAEG